MDSTLIGRGGNGTRRAHLNKRGDVVSVGVAAPPGTRDYGYYPSRPNTISPDHLPPTNPARPISVTAPGGYCPPRNRSNPVGDTARQWAYVLPDYHNTTRDDVQAFKGPAYGRGDGWDLRRGMCYGGNEPGMGPVIPPSTDILQAPLTAGRYQPNLQSDDFTDMGMATFGGPRSADADPSIIGKNVRTRNASYFGDPNARPPSHLDPRNMAEMPNPGGGMTGAQAGYLPRGTDACNPLGFTWNDRYEVLARTGPVSRSDNANGGPESLRGADPAAWWFGPNPPGGGSAQVPEQAATGRTYTFDEKVAEHVRKTSRNTNGIDRREVSRFANMGFWDDEMRNEEDKAWWGNETAY